MLKQENSLTANVGGDIDDDDDEEEQTRSSQMISTSPSYTSKEIQLILAQYNNQEQKKLSDRMLNSTYDDKPENDNSTNNNNGGIEQKHTGSQRQHMMTSFEYLREQRSDNDDNCDRFHRIKFTVLRAKLCNHLAYRYYHTRQQYVSYFPLQILAMLSSILGYLSTSGFYEDIECENKKRKKTNIHSLVEGIIGTMMVFLISLGKNLDYDAKAKQHELIAATMKWLLDDLDILMYKSTDSNNSDADADADSITKKAFEKVESDFFSYTQTIQTVLPDKIGLAFSKLQFQLKLLRVNKDSVYHNDDILYYRISEFAYSELAVILGGNILFLPTPEVSVKMTIDRINALLPSS